VRTAPGPPKVDPRSSRSKTTAPQSQQEKRCDPPLLGTTTWVPTNTAGNCAEHYRQGQRRAVAGSAPSAGWPGARPACDLIRLCASREHGAAGDGGCIWRRGGYRPPTVQP